MADAEAYARKNGRSKIFLWFVKKDASKYIHDEHYGSIINEESQDWRVKHILMPLASMSPIVKGYGIVPSDSSFEVYSNGNLVYPEGFSEKYRPPMEYHEVFANLKVNKFEGLVSSNKALDHIEEWLSHEKISQPVISITIREYKYDPIRNSNIKEWLKFADWLKDRKYLPVIIPDSESAWESNDKFNKHRIFKEACWNLDLRMAFYNTCALNYFYSNGVSVMALVNKEIRCIAMNPIFEESEWVKQETFGEFGLKPGQRKHDFGQDFQWLSWKEDSFENLVEEFLEYEKKFLN